MSELLKQIEIWAGELRSKTFLAAAEFILRTKPNLIVETGCYRGGDSDGHSTLVFAALAKEVGGYATSFDNDPKHVQMAVELLGMNDLHQHMLVIESDSVTGLSLCKDKIGFLYLDSYDFGPDDAGPCQRHQLAEVGAAYGKLTPTCGILLDDYDLPHNGKTGLSIPFLTARGWRKAAYGYQMFLTRE